MELAMRPRFLCVIVGVCLLGLSACSQPPGSGSIDGIDLGLRTELHLDDLQRGQSPDADVVDRVREMFVAAPAGLDSLRVYSASAVVDDDEGAIGLTIWLMPLAGGDGGWLAIALDESGVVRRSRIWGSSDFDEDPEAAWENYWRQFEYDQSRATVPPEAALSSGDVDSLWGVLEADTSAAAATARLLYEHRLLMYENSFVVRRSMAVARGDAVPPVEWLTAGREMYARMEGMSDELRPIIGDSAAARYAAVSSEGGEILALAVEDAAAGRGDQLRERIPAFRRRTCGACHGIENHDAGEGKLKDAIFARLAELGVRRDLYSVDRDVWGVPGEAERSQAIADAVKAILVIAGAEASGP